MNSRGSRGSARSSASQSATSIVRTRQRARCLRRRRRVRPHLDEGEVLAADRLDVPRRAHALGDREARRAPGRGRRRPRSAARSCRSGSSELARSTSPGASQSPSRSGANPSQVRVERSRWRSVRWSSGIDEGDQRPAAALRVERPRTAHAVVASRSTAAPCSVSEKRISRPLRLRARMPLCTSRSRVARVAGAATPAPSSTPISTLARIGPGVVVDDVLAEEGEQQLLRLTTAHSPSLRRTRWPGRRSPRGSRGHSLPALGPLDLVVDVRPQLREAGQGAGRDLVALRRQVDREVLLHPRRRLGQY